MRMIVLLTLLVLVGAIGEQTLVHITFDPEPRIAATETIRGQAPTPPQGSWSVAILDQDGALVQQTSFDPSYIGSDGEQRPLDEVWVSIPADPRGMRLVLIDDTGARRDSELLASACGDGICQEHERGVCATDCPYASEARDIATIQTTPLATSSGLGWRAWAIGGASLLVIILILLLIHLNRKKENPLAFDTAY